MRVTQSGQFDLMYRDLTEDDLELRKEIARRIAWFKKNASDTRLENHPLTKNLEGKWAFSITEDIRIVYEWIGKSTVRFLAIGGHAKVYPNTKPRSN